MPNKYVVLNDIRSIAGATSPADDTFLQDAIDWAESTFEGLTGSQFNQQTFTLVQPKRVYGDRFGWLYLFAAEAGPVTSVSAIQLRSAWANTWQQITWTADNILLPTPDSVGPPKANAWRVQVRPSTLNVASLDDNELLARWTYQGGYASAPPRLRMTIERMALWKYKLREAPLGRVSMPALGVTEVIPALPDDLLADIYRWQNSVLG